MTRAERIAQLVLGAVAAQAQALNASGGLREVQIIVHMGRGTTPDSVEVKMATRMVTQ